MSSANAIQVSSESDIRDLIMKELYLRIGKKNSWRGAGETASFNLKGRLSLWECCAEERLFCFLPSGISISHRCDILIRDERESRMIGIEIKHRSAVTDQFKCRSYDMILLKRKYRNRILGMLIYVNVPGVGIKPDLAKSYCYPFHHFFSMPFESLTENSDYLKEQISIIREFLLSNAQGTV